jgi:hypothetical protein
VEQAKNYRTNFTEVNKVKPNLLLMSEELEDHYGAAVLNDRSAIGKTFANHSYLDHKSFANMSLLKTSLEGRVRLGDKFDADKDLDDALRDTYDKANGGLRGSLLKKSQVGSLARQKLSANERLTALRQSISNTYIKKSIIGQNDDASSEALYESLILAIAGNDVGKFKTAVVDIGGRDKILKIRGEHNMNVLNLAIDMESVEVAEAIY